MRVGAQCAQCSRRQAWPDPARLKPAEARRGPPAGARRPGSHATRRHQACRDRAELKGYLRVLRVLPSERQPEQTVVLHWSTSHSPAARARSEREVLDADWWAESNAERGLATFAGRSDPVSRGKLERLIPPNRIKTGRARLCKHRTYLHPLFSHILAPRCQHPPHPAIVPRPPTRESPRPTTLQPRSVRKAPHKPCGPAVALPQGQ